MIFLAHMTRLAKANKIVPSIGSFSTVEKPEWLDVVNWKAFADMFPAIIAISALILHDSGPRNKPTPAAIGSRAANPIRCVCTFRLCVASALGRAKARNAILTGQPRLLIEPRATMLTGQRNPFLPTDVGATPYVLGSECVRWALTGAKLVADEVRFWLGVKKCLSLPFGSARGAAKPGFFNPIGLNVKRGLADFAGFFNHAQSIPQPTAMGKRTTLIACKRVEDAYMQPDLFVDQPAPQPVQKDLDL